MFMFDIETAGIESTSVVLSAAIIYWSHEEDFTYNDLIKRAKFVKFDAAEQIKKYKRITDKSTLEWWAQQSEHARNLSLVPHALDHDVDEGMDALRDYYKNAPVKGDTIWIRGSLDQLAIDSLTRSAGVPDLAKFWVYRDVRTAIDLLCETAKNGYCDVPGFDKTEVKKHDPVHDCAYDIMMMRYGK